MGRLTLLFGVSVLLVSGCGRATTKTAPGPGHLRTLGQVGVQRPSAEKGTVHGASRSPAETAAWRKAREDDIREAIFRYQLRSDHGVPQSEPSVFFISVEGKDPSDDFLRRFTDNDPPVRKWSRSRISRKRAGFSWMWVEDRETGEPGLIYTVGSIGWLSDSAVLVQGEYYAGGRAGAGYEYRVAYEDKHWVVKQATEKWIS